MTLLDLIPDDRTSITDTDRWREFCARAAEDLSLLDVNEGVFFEVICRRDHAEARYQLITERIDDLFGSWEDWRILEVGGGYGRQALSMLQRYPCSYSILDLPEPLALQRAFLATYGYALVEDAGPADLFISNYALSECSHDIQRRYLWRAAQCARGYITWNGWTHDTLSREEFQEAIPGSVWIEELYVPSPDPREHDWAWHKKNGCLIWNRS
jgi:hypothetical protein